MRGPDGAVRPIGVLGTALGIVPDPDLMEVTIRLVPGELVCMFTDGLVEAQDGDDLFGFERPAALLAKTPSSAKAVVDDLAQAAHLFSHGVLRDDLAILALSVEAVDTD
jgi:sigma-B regulation protein RsbU (phosphoserine phosphatase)